MLSDRTDGFDGEEPHRSSQLIDATLAPEPAMGCQPNKRGMALEIKLVLVSSFTKTSPPKKMLESQVSGPAFPGKLFIFILERHRAAFEVSLQTIHYLVALLNVISRVKSGISHQSVYPEAPPAPRRLGQDLRGTGSGCRAGRQCDGADSEGLMVETEPGTEPILLPLEVNPGLLPPETRCWKTGSAKFLFCVS